MSELSETALGYMQTPNGNVVGLFREGDRFFTRSYAPIAPAGAGPDDDQIDLTQQQADEYLRIMASCGGVVTNQRMRPRLVAQEDRSA